MPDVLVLEWSPSRLRLRSLSDDVVVEVDLPSLVPGARHDLALFPGPRLCVRVPGGARTPFLLGSSLEHAPRVPGSGALATPACRAHADGTLTALDGATLWILPPSPGVWVSRSIPEGIQARDVSLGADGCLYVCGSASGRAVVVRLEPDDDSQLVPILTAADRKRLSARGADETFWRVDASAEPLVLIASCAWLFEDETDFAVVRWRDTWKVRTSERHAIRNWCRVSSDGISIYTAHGERHSTSDAGASWTITDLVPTMQAAWKGLRQGTLVVRAAREVGGYLLLATSAYDWRAPEGKQLLGSAVLMSSDAGREFAALATTVGSECEIVDACFSAR